LIVSLANLGKSGYIEEETEEGLVQLTEKGFKEVELLQAKTKEKNSSLKVKSVLTSFLTTARDRCKSTESLP
jgi:hypothetical protein